MFVKGPETIDDLRQAVLDWTNGGPPVKPYCIGESAGAEPMAGLVRIDGPEHPNQSWTVHCIVVDGNITKVLWY